MDLFPGQKSKAFEANDYKVGETHQQIQTLDFKAKTGSSGAEINGRYEQYLRNKATWEYRHAMG